MNGLPRERAPDPASAAGRLPRSRHRRPNRGRRPVRPGRGRRLDGARRRRLARRRPARSPPHHRARPGPPCPRRTAPRHAPPHPSGTPRATTRKNPRAPARPSPRPTTGPRARHRARGLRAAGARGVRTRDPDRTGAHAHRPRPAAGRRTRPGRADGPVTAGQVAARAGPQGAHRRPQRAGRGEHRRARAHRRPLGSLLPPRP